jgi:competence protein ComEC
MTLIYLAIAWMLGVVAADVLPIPLAALQAGALLGGLAVAGLWRRPGPRLAALALCCAALGGWRDVAARPVETPRSVWRLAGQGPQTLDGYVSADPKRTADGQQVVLAVEAVRAGAIARPAEGLVLLNLPAYPEVRYGQRLRATGALEPPRAARRPGEFDYRDYLARKGIRVLIREPHVAPLPGERGNPLLRAIFALRERARAVLLRELPEPQASIAVGVLLGLQSTIPDDVYATFSATGTSHILVVSGWNFTIVAAVLAGLCARARLRRGPTFTLALGALWTYALFVGATGTVLRAAVMASLMVLARASQRRSEPWTLLCAACWALSAYDPNMLWDLGFQLSALATASLFAFGKPVEAWLLRCPPLRWPALGWAAEALTATLAAQILALPLILYQFGNLSLVAPLANILLLPVVPPMMFWSALALAAGFVWLPAGQLLALPAFVHLAWLTEGARLLAGLPWAAVRLPPFPLWLLLGYYLIVGGAWLINSRGGAPPVPGAILTHREASA